MSANFKKKKNTGTVPFQEVLEKGTYNATTHPEIFSGTGSIILQTLSIENMVILESGMLKVKGNLESLEIYNLLGQRVYKTKSSKERAP